MTLFHKLLCLLGIHGPHFFDSKHERSKFIGMYQRTCTHCGTVWKADAEDDQTGFSLVWKRVKGGSQ